MHEHAERLQGKIVVSMANNLVKHGNEFNAVLPPHGSVAAEIQALLWRSHVCTAFHLVPAAEFADLDHTMESDVVVLGDQRRPKAALMEITSSIPNLRPLDGGSLRNASAWTTFRPRRGTREQRCGQVCGAPTIRYEAMPTVSSAAS